MSSSSYKDVTMWTPDDFESDQWNGAEEHADYSWLVEHALPISITLLLFGAALIAWTLV